MARKRRDRKRAKPHDVAEHKGQHGREEVRPVALGIGHKVLLALALAGAALTAYLTVVKWFGATPLYCGRESSCDLVQSSRWSTLLGLPLSFWGLVTYILLAGLIWRMRRRRATWARATFIACVAAGISVYLTAVSVLVIKATCMYCLASLVIVLSIAALLLFTRPAHLASFRWRSYLPATLLSAALAVAALHLHYSGVFDPSAGPEKPYLKALAMHLDSVGAKFYGAYWCPHCQEQKALFESSAARLPYVECTPEGRHGPVNAACVTQGIEDYPTWIINGRKLSGVQQPETLATVSRFVWREPSP